jgi:hypothetical protein
VRIKMAQSVSLFGYEFKKKSPEPEVKSFVAPENDDGAVNIIAAAGAQATYLDLDGTVRSEAELVTKYRDMVIQPEIDAAVDEIINEIVDISEDRMVTIVLDQIAELSDPVKKKITEEFENVLGLLDFNRRGYEILKRWYVDGRLYYHAIYDEKKPREGLIEVRHIDPRKIRKVREIVRKKVEGQPQAEAAVPVVRNEYYLYNDRGFGANGSRAATGAATGLKIAKDSIIYVVSGLTDTNQTMVLSYLHKAIKALNQLRAIEDSLVIYRLVRAPERRIWYIDVGNLPKMKAEQYVRDIMTKHKNRLVYDASTGEVKDDRKFMTMTEDYWLPRREGGRGTEVDTLQGGQNLSQMDDVLYFQKRLYNSLNVPVNRLNSDALFSIGRATEVTRDEVKFDRFIVRLRSRSSELFLQILKNQLMLKNIMTLDEWTKIEAKIKFDWAKSNYFTELKDKEIMAARFELFQQAEDAQIIGRAMSYDTARRKILMQSEDEIEEENEKIDDEIKELKQNMDPGALDVGDGSGGGEPSGKKKPPHKPTKADKAANNLESDGRIAKMRNAKVKYEQLKKKGANRSPQEESDFKRFTQIVAKNKG